MSAFRPADSRRFDAVLASAWPTRRAVAGWHDGARHFGRSDTSSPRVDEMPYVQTDLRIHYQVVGDGPPVLWHTGGCGDGEMWQLGGYLDGLPGHTHLLMDHR